MMLTVLMPTYNSCQYIETAIKSVLNQTYKDLELLIVDDGSTDDTESSISEFSDTRIRYIKKEHEGLAASLNYGLKIAKHDWVSRMDADDISHPKRLEKQISILEKDDNFGTFDKVSVMKELNSVLECEEPNSLYKKHKKDFNKIEELISRIKKAFQTHYE